MNKISKNLLVGATVLTLGAFAITSIAPAFALDVNDGDVNGVDGATRTDLNIVDGAVSDSELVQITVDDILSISVANPGQVTGINPDTGTVTTSPAAPFDVLPAEIGTDGTDPIPVLPGETHEGGSSQVIKGNNPTGFFMSIMMCSDADTTNFPTIETDVPDCKGGRDLKDANVTTNTMTIQPTNAGTTLTGTTTATTGGFWGYRFGVVSAEAAVAKALDGNYASVPAFSDTTPWGTTLFTTTKAGIAAANIVYGIKTNANLPAGTYNNYVIYTAVNNPATP